MLWELWGELMRPEVAVGLHVAAATVATGHAVLTKDEPRAAVGWVGLIWLSPLVGSFLYYVLGINRIRRKAVAMMGRDSVLVRGYSGSRDLLARAGLDEPRLARLGRLGDRVAGMPLTAGNRIVPLLNGDQAFPAMLGAIRQAERSVMLSSYIFDYDDAGREFLRELAAAVKRGVEVRVLVDATGSRYSFPSVVAPLRRAGVRVARFMPNFYPTRMSAFNLRSHRKILVVDGQVGFTGGMNIREENYIESKYRCPIQDLHFQVEGPVVAHLRQAFIEDWVFTTREVLSGDSWLAPLPAKGDVLARGVLDGPDRDFEKILWTMLGAVSAARRSIRIVTPYFLPEPTTLRFLNVAALAGVDVEILIPESSNIKLVQWATMAVMPLLLQQGVKVYLSPPPFDHSKMMLVDDAWSLIGSANWDSRSLRLNFEFNIECFSAELASELNSVFERKKARARALTMAEVSSRSMAAKLRDGFVRLAAPYL